MKIKKTDVVVCDITGAEVERMKSLFDEIGKLPANQQAALVKMAADRIKKAKVAAEMTAFEENLYAETHRRARETKRQ